MSRSPDVHRISRLWLSKLLPFTILQDGWGWGFKGAGGVLTTLDDLLAWDRALRGSKILDERAKAKLYQPKASGYALGWYIEPSASGVRAHHSGATRGFRAELSRDIEGDTEVVVITNERQDPVSLAGKLHDALDGRPATPPVKIFADGYDL